MLAHVFFYYCLRSSHLLQFCLLQSFWQHFAGAKVLRILTLCSQPSANSLQTLQFYIQHSIHKPEGYKIYLCFSPLKKNRFKEVVSQDFWFFTFMNRTQYNILYLPY